MFELDCDILVPAAISNQITETMHMILKLVSLLKLLMDLQHQKQHVF
ncbi:hypothetical protein ACVQ9Z_12915 [Staphylococcus aureus]